MSISTGNDYVQTPQNDLQQLRQIESEYSCEPAKGIAHGIQKDAVQNGVGARAVADESKAFKDWKITFELLKVNNKYALSFWDEGTTGLIGEVLSNTEIQQWSAEKKLTSDQKLGRFLSRFDSGGGIGAGCFGRGKLIFQAGSENYEILCDSLRKSDSKYIAFDRKINNQNLLVQRRVPFVDEEAKKFINEKSAGMLTPLNKPGTRITILNLRDEITDVFKKSFQNNIGKDDWDVFSKMISETWWEILHRFNAEIYLKYNSNVLKVPLYEPLKSIVEAKDRDKNWRVYKKKNLTIIARGERYQIKELKLVLSPENLYEDFHDFWIQRRRMKIGSIKKNIMPHHSIQKRIAAYVVPDSNLENLIVDAEGLTHYGFDLRVGGGISKIREVLRTELVKFEQKLGLQHTNIHKSINIDMADAMSEINKMAKDLGLLTDLGEGLKIKDVDISLKSFKLPNSGSKRVDDNQDVGPIELELKNNTADNKKISLFVYAKQKVYNREADLYKAEIDINSNSSGIIKIPAFQFTSKGLEFAQGVMIYFKAECRNTGKPLGRVTRMLWYGTDEPAEDNKFSLTAYSPDFPRGKSRRVELSEYIRNIRFKLTNNTAENVKVNADLVIRKAKTKTAEPAVLLKLKCEEKLLVESMQDYYFSVDSIEISKEVFGAVSEGPADADERKCEIYFSARFADSIPALELVKGAYIGKKAISFYVNIDPPGTSIFKKTTDEKDENQPRRSRHHGTPAEGYTFVLNIAHPCYKIADESGIKKEYIMEEMLKQAYAVAIKNNVFKGASESYADSLADGELSPAESFITIDEIIGKALLTMR
jgi:hypothetical protein